MTQPRHNTQLLETIPSPVKLQPKTTATPAHPIHALTTRFPLPHTTPVTKSKEATKEVTRATTTTKAFALQVGTFSNRQNATALVKALKERGFTATTSTLKTKHGTMTRVLIGEKGLTRKQAETTKIRINQTFQINGIVTPITKTTPKTTAKKTIEKHPTTTTHHFIKTKTPIKTTTHTTKGLNTFPTPRNNTVTTPSKTTATTTSHATSNSTHGSDGFAPVTAAQPSHVNPTATQSTPANNTGAVTIP